MSLVAPLVRATRANAPFGAAVLAGIPLAFALDRDAGAVDRQGQRALKVAPGDCSDSGSSGAATACWRQAPPSPDRCAATGFRRTPWSASAPSRKAPSSSGRSGSRPRCSRVAAHACRSVRLSRFMAGSNQTVNETRRLSASLQAGRFRALQVGGIGRLMQTSHHAEPQDEAPRQSVQQSPPRL